MKKRFIFPLLIALGCAACREDEPQDCPPGLPCATQEGANNFGCYINGKPWAPELEDSFTPTLRRLESGYDEPGFGFSDTYFFSISATRRKKNELNNGSFLFNLIPVYTETMFSNGNSTTPDLLCFYGKGEETASYRFDTLYPYSFKITHLDQEKNICTGRFNFRAINQKLKDTIYVTEGRFDVNYNQY